jgi:hypothetical protein
MKIKYYLKRPEAVIPTSIQGDYVAFSFSKNRKRTS